MPGDWADTEARRIVLDSDAPSITYSKVAAALRAERRLSGEEAQKYGWVGDESPVEFMVKLLQAERARSQRVVEAAEKLSDAIDMAEPYYPRELGAIIEHDKVLHAALAARKEAADATDLPPLTREEREIVRGFVEIHVARRLLAEVERLEKATAHVKQFGDRLEPVPVYPDAVTKEACEICWTYSWQPCEGGYSCGYCAMHNAAVVQKRRAEASEKAIRDVSEWGAGDRGCNFCVGHDPDDDQLDLHDLRDGRACRITGFHGHALDCVWAKLKERAGA